MIAIGESKKSTLSKESIDFLNDECDRLMTLYNQAQSNIQNVFNFYLSFITAVLGVIAIVLQLDDSPDGSAARRLIGGVLFFAVLVGTVYLSALSGRYAHAARYAAGIDAIRLYLIDRLGVQMPPIYADFLSSADRPMVKKIDRWQWFIPTGTYEMFMALVNSLALAGFVWLVFEGAKAGTARALIASIIVFLITLTIFNAYSRLVMQRFSSSLNVSLWNESPAWASKE